MLSKISQFKNGFFLPLQAALMILKSRGLKCWALIPLVINILLYILIISLGLWLLDSISIPEVEWDFVGKLGVYLSDIVNYLGSFSKWAVGIPVIILICYFSFTIVGMIIAAPFNDILSEKFENYIGTEQEDAPDIPLRLNFTAALISIYSTLGFVSKQVFWSILALPLLFIPVVGMLPLFLVTSYFSGVGFLDVGMARNYLRYPHKKAAIKQNFWVVLGFGVAMELLFLVPLLGLLMLPLGVGGGTVLYCKVDWAGLLKKRGLASPVGFRAPNIAKVKNV